MSIRSLQGVTWRKTSVQELEDVKNDCGDDDADAADAKKSEEAVVVEEEAKVEDENTPSNYVVKK